MHMPYTHAHQVAALLCRLAAEEEARKILHTYLLTYSICLLTYLHTYAAEEEAREILK